VSFGVIHRSIFIFRLLGIGVNAMAWTYFVVGSGSIGRRHAANLQDLGKTLTHLPWRGFDAEIFSKSVARCEGQAAVIIATATDVRSELVEICASHDAPMYIEKPLAFTQSEVDAMYSIELGLQQRSVVGFMLRYHPLTRFLSEFDGSNFFRMQFEIGHDVRQWRENWSFSKSYAARADGGGVLLDLCHEIDLACMICPTLEVSAVTSIGHRDFAGVDFASNLSLISADGATANVAMDYLSPVLIRAGSLVGSTQNVAFSYVDNTATVSTAVGVTKHRFTLERNAMFMDIMRDFTNLVEGTGTAPLPNMPRMDLMRDSCSLIAQAWEHRKFTGTVEVDLE
jgi:predicted dehydrogenase